MRVAVDVTPLLGPVTGVGQTVAGLLEALPGAAPDVEISRWSLTRRTSTIPPSVLVRLWARADRPHAGRWLPMADVVHGTNFVVPPGPAVTTVTVHDCWSAHRPDACHPTVVAAGRSVGRAVGRGTWVHVSTEWGAEEVRAVYGARRVAVVPFGVPSVPEAGPPPVSGHYVLAIGTFDQRKGFADLVHAFADAITDTNAGLEGLRLVLAGADGPATAQVSAAIAARGVGDRVVRPGRVDDRTRAALLRGAALLAYPSLYEGFGMPPLEAMSVGVPVVATAVGGIPEVVGDAALLVTAGDRASLARALERGMTDEAERTRLVGAGRARAAELTWVRHATGMVDLWRTARESQ